LAVRFVITSGTGIREIVDQRSDARSALEHVQRLVSFKKSSIKIFDTDGCSVSLEKLRRLADAEAVTLQRL
jgi:hypothetical protein